MKDTPTQRITVAYSHWSKSFAQLSCDRQDFVRYFAQPIVLADVILETSPGFRYGCSHTGVLGFATGTLVEPPHFGSQPAIAIKFDGQHFVRRDDGEVLTRCRRLLLTPKGAYADLGETAPQHPIERVHAELAQTGA